MGNDIIPLINEFLFGKNSNKNDVFEAIEIHLKNHCIMDEPILIENIIMLYSKELNNYCIDSSNQHRKEIMPMITMILSVLSLRE